MSFDTPNGTRGARQPTPGRLMRWVNGFVMSRIRRKSGKTMGMNALVLTTIGRKSGEPRSTPVGYFADGENGWLIVASAAGAPKNPAWYYNVGAHPDQVHIEMAGRNIDVSAVQLHGEQRAQAWERIVSEAPRFGKYAKQTDRELPIIRLTPR